MKKWQILLLSLSIFNSINSFGAENYNVNQKIIPHEYLLPVGTKVASVPENIKSEKISFKNIDTGLNLSGVIYTPNNFDKNKKYPAVIVAGPMLSVKEQTQSLYAQRLAEKGYVTMVFDYTYFGESNGEPRYFEDPDMKASDIHSAVTYFLSQKNIDPQKIAAIGICGSGGYVPHAAVTDSRIKAVVSIVPFTVQDEWTPIPLEEVAEARKNYELGKAEPTYISLMEADFEGATYYYNKERGFRENWSNLAVSWSEETWQKYHPVQEVKNWTAPFLVITSENAFTREMAQQLYESAGGKKELYVVEKAGHFDMYDLEPYVSENLEQIEKFLKENL